MQSLPLDIYSVIFSHLHGEKDVANVRLVSKRWQEFARRYITWIQSPPWTEIVEKRVSPDREENTTDRKPPVVKGYRSSILSSLPNLRCPLHLILPRIEDISTIASVHGYPDLNIHIPAPDDIADGHWSLFLQCCFDLIARLRENSLHSKVMIRCCYPHQNWYRIIYYFRYDTGTIDFECDLPGPMLVETLGMNHRKIIDSDLGFSAVAPYINKMGPWILEYVPILQSAFYIYPSIIEVTLPYWSWTIVNNYFEMLVSPSCYITTISYYREQRCRLWRMSSKLEEVWHQIPSGNKRVSLILPFYENFIHNVIRTFPSCWGIGVYIDGTDTSFRPEIVANRIRCQHGIQRITFYVPKCDAFKNPIVYPVIPNVSYLTYTLD